MLVGKFKLSASPSKRNLFRLCIMRSILLLGLLLVLAWFYLYGQIELPWWPLLTIMTVLMVVNGIVIYRLSLPWLVGEKEFFANVLLDIIFLTLIIYYTGGSTNPLVSYYLMPLIISAAVLHPGYTWLIAFLTIALYALLLYWFEPFPLFGVAGPHGGMGPHFLGMWVNFGFSALLIAWFVVRMAQTLRESEQAIARNRETTMRNEQIISVANIAAGAAHELRTPLATMAVLVGEMHNDHPELSDDTSLLQQQIDRCDAILRELVCTATEASQISVGTLGSFFAGVLEKWWLTRPEVRLETNVPDAALGLQIRYDQSLQHALINFLNNAADVSPDYVAFRASTSADGGDVIFTIEDHGPGIPLEVVEHLGKSHITGKSGGLGLGVLLSQASIERLGGKVDMLAGPRGGTQLEVSIPVHGAVGHV